MEGLANDEIAERPDRPRRTAARKPETARILWIQE
jgi:hypothetical protein